MFYFANSIKSCDMRIDSRIAIESIDRLKAVLAGLTTNEKFLADQLGKNESTVSRWHSNSAQSLIEVLFEIAFVLNVNTKDMRM